MAPALALLSGCPSAFGLPQTSTERARMKFASVLLVFVSSLLVGCAGSSPLSPDATSVSSASSVSATSQAFFPPIQPTGISCPSDAPQLRVSSFENRMDIEFSEVAGAYAYEIEILNSFGVKVRLEVPAPAHRAEWRGAVGLYNVRVRTINCGGLGNWSVAVIHGIDDKPAPPPPPPPPPPGPQCISECEPPPPPPQCMIECEPPPPPPQCTSECD
jgi:hypothetical protein